jgi:hypothetical protein
MAGGDVVDLYPTERAREWRKKPWPNRHVLGEFDTYKEAFTALLEYLKRWAKREKKKRRIEPMP